MAEPDNELRQKSLGEILRHAGNSAAQLLTQAPSSYDVAARGAEWLADRYLPAAVSGAMRDARQFVETTPGVRRHTYEDVTGSMARATGLPFGHVTLEPVDHDPFREVLLEPVAHDPFAQAVSPKEPYQ
jgi:hypothetical protein